MEQEKGKRTREGEDETQTECFEKNKKNAKKNSMKKEANEDGCSKEWDESPHQLAAYGVFDFPWLKDGVTSKSEDFDFEDKFSSTLEQEDPSFKAASIEFSEAYGLCETPKASMASHIPDEATKVEDVSACQQPFETDHRLELQEEAEDVDYCIWSSLLNQPL